ncbi:AAA family ATPase [Streptosporangiaceae bacterium NEAU-GS5]|nr:AAA family ATPase [Streptosporangiaceae bacterium NEAU-GS5]
MTVRVAEFADPAEPYLWFLRQPTAFLVEALKEGLASLGESPLGGLLAEGRPRGRLSDASPPPGMYPEQERAYRACLGSGVWLVWGPPGTGKTTVLRRAIAALIDRSERVLLVSATNIAVDNALLGVLRDGRRAPGAVVRVGPPQLREVAENADVSLPLLIRVRLGEVEGRRRDLSTRLLNIQERAHRSAELDAALQGFDSTAYERARRLLGTPGHDTRTCEAVVAESAARLESLSASSATADDELGQARQAFALTEPDRRLWERIDELSAEADQVDHAVMQEEVTALVARAELARAVDDVAALESRTGLAKVRSRRALTAARQIAEDARVRQDAQDRRAASARVLAERNHRRIEAKVRALAGRATHGRTEIDDARRTLATADERARTLAAQRASAKCALDRAEELAERVRQASALVAMADRLGHPAIAAEAARLRPLIAKDAAEAKRLERLYKKVHEEYERLSRDAQGEIIDGAALVATTLARFRTNKRVFAGPYDVVLVDEVGAATLPEVLLAVAGAGTTAVMFGDFMQLGAVINPRLRDSSRSDVRRWLIPDVFRHCGIDDPTSARDHPGCVTLVTQNRFGAAVMDLANALAYDGTLMPGELVRPRDGDDPEIVLIDTDSMHELAYPHLTGPARGWWPVGILLARALVELHAGYGESTGIVTPYRDQAEATLEALRDIEKDGSALTEVGTAHRFQGREFPVVVFDTVEGQQGRPLWMAAAGRGAGAWAYEGLRLFNVAVTRVKARLYIIASGERIRNAAPGTAFGHVRALYRAGRVRRVEAAALVTPPSAAEAELPLGPFGAALREVLARHVEVTDVYDEKDFFTAFAAAVRHARHSLWIWTPWVATRVLALLPELAAAARRNVRITVFIRDPTDQLQQRNAELIGRLRQVVQTVVPIHDMHQKIVVVDDGLVMIGSLNSLSQSRTREVMLTMRGGHFARRILEHEHAKTFAAPPPCPKCGRRDIEIRRGKNGWYWRCYNAACPARSGSKAWKQDIAL